MSRIKTIVNSVASEYGIPKEALFGGIKRDIAVTAARAKIIYTLRESDKPLSYNQIGNYLNLNHTSCIYLYKKMKTTNEKYYDNLLEKVGERTRKNHERYLKKYKLLKLKKEFEKGIMIEMRV